MTAILVIALLLILNALFVAAEFAVLAAKESRIRRAAADGLRSARLLLPVVEDPRKLDRYISACQLGITTTTIGLGAYSQYALGNLTPILVLVLVTAVQVVVAEQVPKSIALHRPARLALFTVWPVTLCLKSLGFLITFLVGSSRLILKLIGTPTITERHVHSRQEIDVIMEQSHERGVFESDQHERLQHVLDLEVVTARQLMIPRKEIAAIEVESQDAVLVLMEEQHTRLPVYRGSIDDVIGVIHTKDVARNAVEKGSIKDWRKMIRPIVFVNEGMTGERLLAVLREKKTQQAMVMDEFGGVAGLVTLENILTHVFGQIDDEFSQKSSDPQVVGDGLVRLPGRLRLDEVEEWIHVAWTGVSTTVGGFVTERMGHIPAVGEESTIDGVEIRVESVEDHVVTSVLARPVPVADQVDPHGRRPNGRRANGRRPKEQDAAGGAER